MAPPDSSAGPTLVATATHANNANGNGVASKAPQSTNGQAPYYRSHSELVPLYVPGDVTGFSLPPAGTVVEGLEHSGPQGKVIPLTIVEDPADWTAQSLESRADEYTYTFTDEDLQEIFDGVEAIKSRGVDGEGALKKLTTADYDWPKLKVKISQWVKDVRHGFGFKVFKNFPAVHYQERKDRLGLIIAYWGLALHAGAPQVTQTDYRADGSVFGNILCHMTAGGRAGVYTPSSLKKGLPGPITRPGQGNVNGWPIIFHNDQGASDLISFFFITSAQEGGHSKWVSGVAIHNELLRRGRKDLVEVLSKRGIWNTPRAADQWTYERRKEDDAFAGFEDAPPFEYHDGYLTTNFLPGRQLDIPDITPLQREALWAFATLAEDPAFHLRHQFQPGELIWLHNPTVLHSRNEVYDAESNALKRHMIRWWAHSHDNPRPIAPRFAPRSNVFAANEALPYATGGFRVPAEELPKLRLPLYPLGRHDELGQSPVL